MNFCISTIPDRLRYTLGIIRAIRKHRIRSALVGKYFDDLAGESLWIVLFSVSAASAVTVLESMFHMNLVLSETSMVPGFSSLVIVRELGPVVTGLFIASLVGTGWSAETALMNVSEQIDALKLMGIDPYERIVLPRILGSVTGVPVLSVIATVAALLVTMAISVFVIGSSPGVFIDSLRVLVSSFDIVIVMLKGAAFGLAIAFFASFHGLNHVRSASDVGRASTRSLVSSTVSIIILDFILNWVNASLY